MSCRALSPFLALLALALPDQASARAPNVILIVADDLGWADLGCYGSTFHKTAALDRLARQGVRFTTAYAACPVCSPTRAALLTGRAPARVGVTDWLPGRANLPDQPLAQHATLQQLPLEETTLAEALKAAGYVTGLVGKWHLGGKGFEPERQGFDHNVGGDHTGTALSYFAPYERMGRTMPGLEKAEKGEYLTDRLGVEAEKFIEKNKDKPFFLYLAHYAPHTPMKAKADVLKKYPDKPAFGRQSNSIYAAMLESLDDSVARVLKKLDDLKLADDTVVVFTSDNGGLATLEGPNTPPTYNGPLREGKGFLYEGGLRVPLIVRWPGAIGPATSGVPVVSHDLYPTLLAACGVAARGTLDGVDLLPLLKGGAAPKREAIYWHYPHYSNQRSKPGGAIREGRFKLVEFYEYGRRELFDLEKDASESRNLAAEKADVVKSLAAKLEAWRKEVGAPAMKANPKYVPNPQDKAGVVTMHAKTARVYGTQLRYEPLPHKETLGYWTQAADYAAWTFTVTTPGAFRVEVLQGCGKGQGGSEVAVEAAGRRLTFEVKDTGGFQAFEARDVGELRVEKAGRFELIVRPVKKAKAAVMDVRQVRLVPVK